MSKNGKSAKLKTVKKKIESKNNSHKTVGSPTLPCQKCHLDVLTVKCGHTKRNFVMNVLSIPAGSNKNVLQVIADDPEGEILHINFSGVCVCGKPHSSSKSSEHSKDKRPNDLGCCPSVSVSGGTVNVEQPSPLQVQVYSKKSNTEAKKDLIDFLLFALDFYSSKEVYTLAAKTCQGKSGNAVSIEAYSSLECEGKIAVGYSHGTQKNSNFNQQHGYKKLKVDGEWEVEGKLSIACGKEKKEFGGAVKYEGGHYKDNAIDNYLFKNIQCFLDKVTPFLSTIKSDYAEVAINWPKLELACNLKNQESAGAFDVVYVGSIELAFSPLIGADLKVDILSILIAAAGGGAFGAFLLKIRKNAEDIKVGGSVSVGAEVKIIFSIGGNISGKLGWKWAGEKSTGGEGEIKGAIPISLEGKAEAHFDSFFIKFAGGAKMGAKSEIGAKLTAESGGHEPEFSGKLYFSGVTIYYAYYMKFEQGEQLGSQTRALRKSNEPKESSTEFANSFEWIQPAEWPENNEPGKKVGLEGV